MNPFTVTVNRLLASALTGAALLILGTSLASAQVLRVPGDRPGVPLYTRTGQPFVFHTEQWAAIVFYRQPDCVPGDVNLLQIPHPGAFDCPLVVSGFEVWDNPATDAGPRQGVSSGSEVPVWFVPWTALQAAIADDVLTKLEIESLAPLKGVAKNFHEVIHPIVPPGTTGGGNVPHLTIIASGVLADGRSFQYEFNDVAANKPAVATNQPADIVRIVFR